LKSRVVSKHPRACDEGGFESVETLCLRGKVFSGKGEGATFLRLSWARRQIEEKLGFSPYQGTLNIRLTRESTRKKRTLMNRPGAQISPAPDHYSGRLFRANLMNLECALIVPEVPGYPEDIIELVSPANLRQTLHLVDGALCEVVITV
jgi:riboflavin kinase